MTLQYPQWIGLTFLIGSTSTIICTFIMRRMASIRLRKWDYLRVDLNRTLASLIAEENHFRSGNISSSLQLRLAELKHKVRSSSTARQILVAKS